MSEGPAPPPAALVLVATPIGNLGDLSPRARASLAEADVVCCEDTRRTRVLLSAAGIGSGDRLVSLHGHNEAARIPQVLDWLTGGRTVALVSDAGTPGISDPGQRLVAAAAARGVVVTVVPGPSAVLAALVVSGLSTDRFCVEGFLPRAGGARARRLRALAAEERTAVLLEAPGRLPATLADLERACGDRQVVVARELTKVHEEIWRGTLEGAVTAFGQRALRGEVVIVLAGAGPAAPATDEELSEALRSRLSAGEATRQAARTVADQLGVGRRRAYEVALAVRHEGERTGP